VGEREEEAGQAEHGPLRRRLGAGRQPESEDAEQQGAPGDADGERGGWGATDGGAGGAIGHGAKDVSRGGDDGPRG
jgi:hypothetical protein